MSSADHICKQFGPRADVNVGPDHGLIQFVWHWWYYLKEFFDSEKIILKKKNNSMQSYPVGKVLIENRLNIKGTVIIYQPGEGGWRKFTFCKFLLPPPPPPIDSNFRLLTPTPTPPWWKRKSWPPTTTTQMHVKLQFLIGWSGFAMQLQCCSH